LSFKNVIFICLFSLSTIYSTSLLEQLGIDERELTSFNSKDDLGLIAYINKKGLYKISSRPQLPEYILSTDGHFKIHYTTTGQDSVSIDDKDNNGIPDYIDEVSRTAERAYRLLIDTLGFEPPPIDGVDGDEIDIYVRNLKGNYYGITWPENAVTSTKREYDYTSYLEIDNDYSETAYNTKGIDALHVTISHEFFHMVQLGYNWYQSNNVDQTNGDTFFLEWCSVWFEERAYPEANDYLNYLGQFFYFPYKSVWDNSYSYSLGIFLRYVFDLYGEKIIKEIWDKIGENKYAMDAFNEIMSGYNTNMAELWNGFFYKIYYSNNKYDPDRSLCADAKFFPPLNYSFVGNFFNRDTICIGKRVNRYATLPVLLTFNDRYIIQITDISKNFELTIFGYLIDRYLKDDIFGVIGNSRYFPLGWFGSHDTLAFFITNTSLDSSISVSFNALAIPEGVEISSEITKIYPNPLFTDDSRLSIELFSDNSYDKVSVNLFDILGRKVYSRYIEKDIELGINIIDIDISEFTKINLSSGVYIVHVKLGENNIYKKVTFLR